MIWSSWAPSPDGKHPGIGEIIQRPFHPIPLALATGLCLISVLLTFVRWYILVRAQELPFTLPDALRLGLIGYFLNTFLPGSIGGDILKAAFIAREQSRRTVAVATVLLDRAVGLWGLCWLVTLLGGVFWLRGDLAGEEGKPLEAILFISASIVGASVVGWFLLGFLPPHRAERFAGRLRRLPTVGHAMSEFWRAIWMYRRKGKSVALALLLALVGHLGFVMTFYCAVLTFLEPAEVPSLASHYLIVPVAIAITAGIPTPGGIGGGEAAYGWVYFLIGFPKDNGVLGCFTQRVITWGLGLIGLFVYLRMRPALSKVQAPSVDDHAAQLKVAV
jgi:uncharacterized protein (TIRG00374 family)